MSEKPVAPIKTFARYEPETVYIGAGEYIAECVRADDGDYYLAADVDAAIEALLDERDAQQAEIERLRAEVAEWKRVAAAQAELHGEAEERAEQLAKVLRLAEEHEHINAITPRLVQRRATGVGHNPRRTVEGEHSKMTDDHCEKIRAALAHEIWAAAQLAPGEGIADGVARIETLLRRAIHSAITHCDKCGCSWLDDGVNPIGCPYCEHIDWRAVNTELLPPPPGEASSFGNYEVHDNETMAAYARANIARAVASLQVEMEARAQRDEALLREALYALEYASDMTKPDEDLQGCECTICTNIAALRERLGEKE